MTGKFKKNARVATSRDFAEWEKNKDAMKAKGLRLTREQGNWLLIDLTSFVTEKFWSAWRTRKPELKEQGYNVTRIYDHWVVY